ncbi:PAS domain S-box protein [Mariprofundus sp. KV]|uniref:PAS domain S-box protein n=1 Tax=Mariprofundus sp. KV TaxID=2608715 RepID=UPI0015A4A00A|nr:PAS domain S-box protein [Mariprofundus sp. KV]
MLFNPFAAQSHTDHQEILVGSELDYPPYATVDKDGNADGFSVDLIKSVAEAVGLKIKFQVGPWSEVKAKLERGEIDALPLVAYSTEREKYFDFSKPHIIGHAVAFVRKGSSEFKAIDDLRGKEVIVMRSDSTHEYVKFSAITDKIILTDTLADAFQLLSSGRHDFVIAPKLSGLLLLNELGINNVETFGGPLESYGKGYAFAVHEGDSELLAHLEHGLVLVKASGEYDQIYDKWFGHIDPRQKEQSQLIRYALIGLFILACIILVGSIWNLTLRRKVALRTQELLESETRFAATFAEAAIGLAHVAPDGSWIRVNQALCDIVGYSNDELLKLTFQDITHPDDLNADLHFVEQMLSGEIHQYSMEKRYFRKDGSTVWINLTVSLVRKESGEADYFISAVEDISRRKALDALVGQSKDELERFFDLVPDMVCVATPDGYFKKINNTWSNILGYSDEELLSRPYVEYVHPEDRKNTEEAQATLVQGIKVFQFTNRYRCKDGTYRWLEWVSAPGLDGTIYAIARDITERREADELVLRERNLAQKYLDIAGVMMVALDVEGNVTLINRKGLEILGFEEHELLHKNWFDTCLPTDVVEEVSAVFKEIITGEVPPLYYYENPVVTKSGEHRIIAFHNTMMTNSEGEIIGLLSSGEDVTDRIMAEKTIQALVETTSRYVGDEFFRSSVTTLQQWLEADAVILSRLVDEEHVQAIAMRVGDKFVEDYSYALAHTPCKNVIKDGYCSYPENAMQLFPQDEDLITMQIEGYIGEPLKSNDGEVLGLLCALSKKRNHFPEHAQDVMKIVAARAASELERREVTMRLDKLSQAVEQAGEGVVITDREGVIEYINPAFSEITGYSFDEVIGENPRLLKSGKHDRKFYESMWATLTAGEVWQGRVTDKRKDGSLYPALVTISPIKSSEGVITHYVGVQQNLKEYEDLERQFHQSQKMEAIGTLVGGIAHDFNNSLAGIAGNLYLARAKSEQPEVLAKLESAEKLAFSAAGTIQQLLTFSRKGVVNMSVFTLAPFLKEVIKLHRISIPESITLHQQLDDLGLKVRGDLNQLQQVILNLTNNARDAVEGVENPQITIALTQEKIAEPEKAVRGQLKGGEYACIRVIDNGCGIAAEDRAHIFEPFFTTKEEGKGTGLGLAMVYGAVKTHNGWIYTTPGEDGVGTIMQIYLPLVHQKAEQALDYGEDTVVEGRGERILLVDDNEDVLNVGKDVLEGLNYRVLMAKDGLEAVALYSADPDKIDLLILDVVMPGMGGFEALKQIRQINPDVKALFATGYNKASAEADDEAFKDEMIISKPFAISALSQLIREQLDARP